MNAPAPSEPPSPPVDLSEADAITRDEPYLKTLGKTIGAVAGLLHRGMKQLRTDMNPANTTKGFQMLGNDPPTDQDAGSRQGD